MKLGYKYIIYNSADYKDGSNNSDGYYTICLNDLVNVPNIEIIGGPLPVMPRFLNYFIRALHKMKVSLLLLNLVVKRAPQDSKDLCVVLMRIFDVTYLTWLRYQYPKAKFVFFLRDLYETKQPHVGLYKEFGLIDYWGSYDEDEYRKYKMDFYYPEIESRINFFNMDLSPNCDVFFAGAAKKRYPQLLKVYDYLTKFGIKCSFIIMDVNEEEKELRDGIIYTHDLIPYREMLIRSQRCNCLLDINQEGAVGNTSRFLEAIVYNKKLITNNQTARDSKFYNPNYICVFADVTEIKPEFILSSVEVDYKYNNEFSPVGLIETINHVIAGN
jgi:hypothetical protein